MSSPGSYLHGLIFRRFGVEAPWAMCGRMAQIARRYQIELEPLVDSVPLDAVRPEALLFSILNRRVELVKATNRWVIEVAARERAEQRERMRGYHELDL